MYLKRLLLIFLNLFFITQFVSASHVIEAENNAYMHNNKGVVYLKEKYYFGAIKEFQIAIDLLPNTQASGIFYTNLGKTYDKIGYPQLATEHYEKALSVNYLCFDYYLTLAEHYKKIGIANRKLIEYQNKKESPLNEIMVGLLFIQIGQTTTGITVLDDFCNKEQNILVKNGVQEYLNKITKNL